METAISRPQTQEKASIFRRIWIKWLKFAEVFGTVQMIIILSIMYWIFLPLMAIPFKLLSDPLASRQNRAGWIKRTPISDPLEVMKNQF